MVLNTEKYVRTVDCIMVVYNTFVSGIPDISEYMDI